MNERIKKLRTYLGLSQEEFGNKIGIKSRAHISSLENGTRNITDRITSDIIREFNVNEMWLKYGNGEMFASLTKEEAYAISVGRIMAEESEFARNTFMALSKLEPSEWKTIEKLINNIFNKNE